MRMFNYVWFITCIAFSIMYYSYGYGIDVSMHWLMLAVLIMALTNLKEK